MPRIALNFEDHVTRFIDADGGESIADAAYRQGVNVPLDCANGVCGTCKAFRQSGECDPGCCAADALSAAEAAAGYILCCQARATSDMVIDIDASSEACKVRHKPAPAEIVGLDVLSAHRMRLSVEPLEGELPMFLPGQYVNITAMDGQITRSYSFASAPGSKVATFLVGTLPGGRMSSYLSSTARRGDRLLLDGPFGGFYLRPPTRPLLFVAAGTGVGPFLSMLGHMAVRRDCDQPVRLVYGVREPADLVEITRIEELGALISNFDYVTTCSGAANGLLRAGRVTDHINADTLNHGDADVYLCGPPDMVESSRRHTAGLGISPSNIHFEKFIAAAVTS